MDDGRNFTDRLAFLRALDADLAAQLLRAGQLAHDDVLSAAVALRCFGESVARRHLNGGGLHDKATFFEILEALRNAAAVPATILDRLDTLRVAGNRGAHPTQYAHGVGPILDLIREAWNVATWLHERSGGRPEEVPAYEAPSPADSNTIFRDAVLGGHGGMGDPLAKYQVAKAILAQQAKKWRALREANDPLEFMYSRAEQVRDLLRDAQYFVPAARTELAKLIFAERAPDDEKLTSARELLDWAVEADEPEALFLLGVFHLQGRYGFTVDVEKAIPLLERAAAHEDSRAFNALALVYRDGSGVEPAPEKAREHARRSAEAGFPIGQNLYGGFLFDGFGGPQDEEEGLVWIRRAVKQDWPTAMFHLATLLLEGHAEAAPGEDAERLLDRACRDECVEALIWRAERELARSDDDADFRRAVADLWHAERIADAPVAAIQSKLGDTYHRLDRYLRSLPVGPRHADLSYLWYHFKADGTRKYASADEMAQSIVAFDGETGTRLSDASMLELVRAHAGPGVSEAEIRRRHAVAKAMMARKYGPRNGAPAPVQHSELLPRVGRNERCPCGSGNKFKKCHGR